MSEIAICVLVVIAAYASWRAFRAERRLRKIPVATPKMSAANAKLMGFASPADQKVSIRVGDWDAMKRAIWRSKNAWEITRRSAEGILARCVHAEGCPGVTVETEPCSMKCSDREQRMDALVILNAARTCMPADGVKKPADGPYFAPSREYFSEVLAKLAATEVELETAREALRTHVEPPVTITNHASRQLEENST